MRGIQNSADRWLSDLGLRCEASEAVIAHLIAKLLDARAIHKANLEAWHHAQAAYAAAYPSEPVCATHTVDLDFHAEAFVVPV